MSGRMMFNGSVSVTGGIIGDNATVIRSGARIGSVGSSYPELAPVAVTDAARVLLNGQPVAAAARSFAVVGGRLWVDGREMAVPRDDAGRITHLHVEIHGPVGGSVSTTSGTVTVHGEVRGSATSMSGNIAVAGSVGSAAHTMSGHIYVGHRAAPSPPAAAGAGAAIPTPTATVVDLASDADDSPAGAPPAARPPRSRKRPHADAIAFISTATVVDLASDDDDDDDDSPAAAPPAARKRPRTDAPPAPDS